MKTIVFSIIAVLLSMLESAILAVLPFEFFKPDMALPLVLFAALFLEFRSGIVITVIAAISQEVFSTAPDGTILFTKLAVFFIAVVMKGQVYLESRYTFAIISGVAVAAESVLYLALSVLAKGDTGNLLNVLFYTIPNAVFTAAVALLVLTPVERLNERLSSFA